MLPLASSGHDTPAAVTTPNQFKFCVKRQEVANRPAQPVYIARRASNRRVDRVRRTRKDRGYMTKAEAKAAAAALLSPHYSIERIENAFGHLENEAAGGVGAGTHDRAAAKPCPERSPELVAAMLKDSILGRLQEKYEKQLREIELPEGGFTTIEQARAGKSFAKTFHDLQKRRKKMKLPPLEKPRRVPEAERMADNYYAHHTKTGEFIPPRPRGRPRKTVQPASGAAP
jgi:hypothetical protein